MKEDKKYYFDATVNFRWGATAHVEADEYDFAACLNKMMDMLDLKIKKEKEIIMNLNKSLEFFDPENTAVIVTDLVVCVPSPAPATPVTRPLLLEEFPTVAFPVLLEDQVQEVVTLDAEL